MSSVFVVVSGAPGVGKTTVAKPLAQQLDVPYLGQDSMMEAIFDLVGIRDHSWARIVSQAAMAAMFELAPHCELVVLDAWWERWTEPLRSMRGVFFEVFCHCDPAVAAERAQRRNRHPGHFDQFNDWHTASLKQPDPLGLGGPTLRVDTQQSLNIPEVSRWIREEMIQLSN